MLKKIVVLGPESTGKSTLCEMLAQHFDTQWCPEFAREYLMTNGADYDFEDLLIIAKGQLALEEEYVQMIRTEKQEYKSQIPNSKFQIPNFESQISNPKFLFIDTDQYVMKVWCEYVFGDCHNWILRRIAERPYDLYLLCKPDLPWVPDALREYPDEKPRQELYHIYRDLLTQQATPWLEISGSYEERFEMAKIRVEDWMK
jgi:NadR type nicotinamide-nucleotide adenylyltransferase